MTPEPVAVRRQRWAERVRLTGTGLPCDVCGLDGINVVHDPPGYRHAYHAENHITHHPFAKEPLTCRS